jgi:hypothetical protein
MIRIIETNLSMNNENVIIDHQSRVVEAESWECYIKEIQEGKTVIRSSIYGSLHGNTIPPKSEINNLVFDEFHLKCDITNYLGLKTKKLAYLIDK